ncbi:MAG: glycosyltransferase family 2 protein [Caulobacterales bacterium]|nr:glycosyltransferase family 2 protein [Caulobacterales bacterium]
MGPTISIVIPTQRRPGGLAVALRSALAQTGVDPASLELIVADNDQQPSARLAVESAAKAAPFPVRYVHVPEAGVANVRNGALKAARGELIAFLDDDQEAPAGWLAALLEAMRRHNGDVVFGPVMARAPDTVTRHRAYLERFFSREGPALAGPMPGYFGCGDSLLRRAALPDPDQPFNVARNQMGGEDDLLFGTMQAAGARFVWAPDAWVWEDPIPDRLTLRYTLARAFAYGQGPSEHCYASTPRDWAGVGRWMVIGLGQAVVFGLIAAAKWLVRSPDRARALDRAVRGLGKTLWFGPFKINFYGRSA